MIFQSSNSSSQERLQFVDMKCAMLVCIIAIALVQQKTGNNRSGNAGNHNSKQNQTTVDGSPSGQSATNTTDHNSTGNTDRDQKQKVEIVSAPKVSVKPEKDTLDWIILACTIVLTIVGSIGTYAAVKTLTQIKRQADTLDEHKSKFDELAKAAANNASAAILQVQSMQQQVTEMSVQSGILQESVSAARGTADAALKTATAIVNSERPWMIIEPNRPDNVPRYGTLTFTAWNRGRTPAEITFFQGDFFFKKADEDFAIDPSFKNIEFFHRQYVAPTKHVTIYWFDIQASITEATWAWMEKEGKYLYLFGRVLYRDAIVGDEHESRFCYWLSPSPGIGLIMGGGRNWNKHT
jgi:hypothetical protein